MRRRGPLPTLLLLLVAGSCAWWSRPVPAAEPAADLDTFLRLRAGLDDVLTWTETAGGVFAPPAPDIAAQWIAWAAIPPARRWPECAGLEAAVSEDMTAIAEMGKGRGELLTLRNAGDAMVGLGKDAWFPLQSLTAEWMGDTKVHGDEARARRHPADAPRVVRQQRRPSRLLVALRAVHRHRGRAPGVGRRRRRAAASRRKTGCAPSHRHARASGTHLALTRFDVSPSPVTRAQAAHITGPGSMWGQGMP